jgi:hypothetical protein
LDNLVRLDGSVHAWFAVAGIVDLPIP